MTVSRAPDSARTLYSPEDTGQDHWNSCSNAYSPGDLINSFDSKNHDFLGGGIRNAAQYRESYTTC